MCCVLQTTRALLDQLENQFVSASWSCSNILFDSNVGGVSHDLSIHMRQVMGVTKSFEFETLSFVDRGVLQLPQDLVSCQTTATRGV
jgi:hypothetical protein